MGRFLHIDTSGTATRLITPLADSWTKFWALRGKLSLSNLVFLNVTIRIHLLYALKRQQSKIYDTGHSFSWGNFLKTSLWACLTRSHWFWTMHWKTYVLSCLDIIWTSYLYFCVFWMYWFSKSKELTHDYVLELAKRGWEAARSWISQNAEPCAFILSLYQAY